MDFIPVSAIPLPSFEEDRKLIEHYLSLFLITGRRKYLSIVHSIFFRHNAKYHFSPEKNRNLVLLLLSTLTNKKCPPNHRVAIGLHLINLFQFVFFLKISPNVMFIQIYLMNNA